MERRNTRSFSLDTGFNTRWFVLKKHSLGVLIFSLIDCFMAN